MKEFIHLIFTDTNGQIESKLPLDYITMPIQNQDLFIQVLISTHSIIVRSNRITESLPDFENLPVLQKVSCAIHTDTFDPPQWYLNCEGKFFFED